MSGKSPLTHSLRAAIAAAALTLPVLAAASTTTDTAPRAVVRYDASALTSEASAEQLYARLKEESRRICGSSDILMTGSIRRSVNNETCYEGTLGAAVERLGNPRVTALHEREI